MSDHQGAVAALMGLPGATSHRLGRLLATAGPVDAWARVGAGTVDSSVAPPDVRAQWRLGAASIDPRCVADRLRSLDLVATCWHDTDHPPDLTADIDPAPVVVRAGRRLAGGPRVGIVGTRRSSSVGREIAFELGAGLAGAGVAVVSGLALGIDGAAHRGALSADGAPPVAVVGSGADVVYPARHHELWAGIVAAGSLFTEVPLGGAPEPWRFPARNRLIAALSDLVVVVESRSAGGSLLTVEQAIRRDVSVMAVPGSLRNPAAAGTNQLLADGCAPARDVVDILVALGLSEATTAARRRGETSLARSECPFDVGGNAVLEAVDDGPSTLDDLVRRTGLAVPKVLAGLDGLLHQGRIATDGARFTRGERQPPNPR